MVNAVQRNFRVVAAFGRNGAAVDFLLIQRFFVIGVYQRFYTGRLKIIIRFLFRVFQNRVAHHGKLHRFLISNRGGDMVFGNSSAADQCKA